jgi:hypothetical protein
MQFFINLFKSIVFSNLWISLGALSLTLNFYILNDIYINKNVLAFVFFSTLFSYNFQRLIKIKFKINLKGERVDWIKTNTKGIYLISIIALIGSLFYGIPLLDETWWLLLIIGSLTFFYVWKIPGLKGKSLRDVPTLKIFVIAIVWVLFCVIFPAVIENVRINSVNILFYSLSVFTFMIAITIPFDVRDLDLDALTKKTIPQLIGEKKSSYLSAILLLISQVILFSVYPKHIYGITLFSSIALLVLMISKKRNGEFYFACLVDGLLLFQMVLILLF